MRQTIASLGGSGVDGAIHRVGGPQMLEECMAIQKRQDGCPTGEAVITTGGDLKAKFVIHTVGPVWHGPQLAQLQQGLLAALQIVQTRYTLLPQAADWLADIADLLDPTGKPSRSAAQVHDSLFAYLEQIKIISKNKPGLQPFCRSIQKTTRSYAPGLFYCYDLSDFPRTNNARESEFRDLNRRLLRTTGQKGLTRRSIQRSGAWELLQRPASLKDTILAFNHIAQQDFMDERQRVQQHRDRFRLYTRSAKQSRLQLSKLEQRWAYLSPN